MVRLRLFLPLGPFAFIRPWLEEGLAYLGRPVILSGVHARPELNGRRAIAVEVEMSGRVRVQLDGDTTGLFLKPSTCRTYRWGTDAGMSPS